MLAQGLAAPPQVNCRDLERSLYRAEDGDELASHAMDGGDDGHGNARGDQGVFNRRRSGFVFQETLQLVQRVDGSSI
jgi:hypothetical protein